MVKKIIIKREFVIVFLIFITIMFMAGLWAADIGASGMILGVSSVQGFSFVRTTNQQYHLGLITAIVTFFIMVMITVRLLFARESNEQGTSTKKE